MIAQLSAMRERTERSARFAAVTALAAGAAHELGSPLGTIAVVAKELEIAAAAAQSSDDIIEDTRLIRTEVDRCRGILDRMRLEVGDDLRYEGQTITAEAFVTGAIADLTEDRKPRVQSEIRARGRIVLSRLARDPPGRRRAAAERVRGVARHGCDRHAAALARRRRD